MRARPTRNPATTATAGRDEFSEFYARYYPRLVGYAARCFGPNYGEEIAQEAMTRALTHFHQIDHERDPWNWLYVVARNYGRNLMRNRRPVQPLDEPEMTLITDDATPTPEDRVIATEETTMLHGALARLAHRDRELLVLRHVDERSVRDIAALVGTNENLTRQRLFRARRRLARQFVTVAGRTAVILVACTRLLRRHAGQATPTIATGLAAATVGISAVVVALAPAPFLSISPQDAVRVSDLTDTRAVASTPAPPRVAYVAPVTSRPTGQRAGAALAPTPDVSSYVSVATNPRAPGQTARAGFAIQVASERLWLDMPVTRDTAMSVTCAVTPTGC